MVCIFAVALQEKLHDRVAQPVEQRPFKPWALGSSPSTITKPSSSGDGFFYSLTTRFNFRPV